MLISVHTKNSRQLCKDSETRVSSRPYNESYCFSFVVLRGAKNKFLTLPDHTLPRNDTRLAYAVCVEAPCEQNIYIITA